MVPSSVAPPVPAGLLGQTGKGLSAAPQRVPATLKPSLLVVDDEPPVLTIVQRLAEKMGFSVVCCSNGVDALAALTRQPADLAMVDLRMPDVGGLDLLRQIRAALPSCDVVLMTGYAAVDSAVEAIKLGAREYMTKPFDFDRLRAILEAVKDEWTKRLRSPLASTDDDSTELAGMVGKSARMQGVFRLIYRLAPHAKVVLVHGETGTGKELAARAFHQAGSRRTKPFVTINCSAVVDTLFESELFGHVRGAFTGAVESKAGLFESAQGGTLFLDEVGELPLAVQAKLLRALENGEVQRVGSLQSRQVDVVVVAATNRELRAEVAAGRFRGDLYFRLNVVEIELPPLRDRRDDIPPITAAFMRACAARLGKRLTGLAPGAEKMLCEARWDGNVRELKNVVERLCVLAEGPVLSEEDVAAALGVSALGVQGSAAVRLNWPAAAHPARPAAPSGALQDLERTHISQVLQQVRGNRMAAARVLGISRRALYRRLERHHISAHEPKDPGDQG